MDHYVPQAASGSSLPGPSSIIFSLVALYYINQLSHKTYGTSPQPKAVLAAKGGKGKK